MISPGRLNQDAGPDFTSAHIRIGGILYLGDVEIHRNVSEWIQHGHQTDPAYNRVILHVVFEGSPLQFPTVVQSGRTVPVLVVAPFLSRSLDDLFQTASTANLLIVHPLPCEPHNARIDSETLNRWICRLSEERLELKVRRLEERLRELVRGPEDPLREQVEYSLDRGPETSGEIAASPHPPERRNINSRAHWDQLLYEGIMDGLGYSKNRRPFVRLARIVTLERLKGYGVSDPPEIEAVLFGVSGLLPQVGRIGEPASRARLRTLRRFWRARRGFFADERLHKVEWKFSPTRPGNLPSLRIAAVPHIVRSITEWNLLRAVVEITRSHPANALSRLADLLIADPDPFWRTHYGFGVTSRIPVRPLGKSRARDIVANVFIPLLLLYARMFRDATIRRHALDLHSDCPPLSGNAILRLMDRQLLRGKVRLDSFMRQQGVIQLNRYYCREKRCSECDIGKLVFKT